MWAYVGDSFGNTNKGSSFCISVGLHCHDNHQMNTQILGLCSRDVSHVSFSQRWRVSGPFTLPHSHSNHFLLLYITGSRSQHLALKSLHLWRGYFYYIEFKRGSPWWRFPTERSRQGGNGIVSLGKGHEILFMLEVEILAPFSMITCDERYFYYELLLVGSCVGFQWLRFQCIARITVNFRHY